MIHTCTACQMGIEMGVYVLTPMLGGLKYEEMWYHFECVDPKLLQDIQMYNYLDYRIEKVLQMVVELRQEVENSLFCSGITEFDVLDIVQKQIRLGKFDPNIS